MERTQVLETNSLGSQALSLPTCEAPRWALLSVNRNSGAVPGAAGALSVSLGSEGSCARRGGAGGKHLGATAEGLLSRPECTRGAGRYSQELAICLQPSTCGWWQLLKMRPVNLQGPSGVRHACPGLPVLHNASCAGFCPFFVSLPPVLPRAPPPKSPLVFPGIASQRQPLTLNPCLKGLPWGEFKPKTRISIPGWFCFEG